MKVGILTFWNGLDNYGQTLQSFALQYFLRKKGYDAYVVKYALTPKHIVLRSLFFPIKAIKYLYMLLFDREKFNISISFKKQKKLLIEENKTHPRNFQDFKNKYIHYSDNIYNQESLFKNSPEADVYIAGSDQIWGSLDPGFFLQFVPKEKKCIAYAPSLGGVQLSRNKLEKFKKYISRFSVLAMREQDGVDLCRSVGRNDAFLVMDPAFLLSAEDYLSISVPIKYDSRYILLYLLGNEMDFDISIVYDWAEKHSLQVKYVASQGRVDAYDKIYPNVDEWLSLVHGAKFVITNSFHGTVFSIIMNKNFLTIPLSGSFARMNGRINDLLQVFELGNRIYSGNMDILFQTICYDKINNYLHYHRKQMSSSFDSWLS